MITVPTPRTEAEQNEFDGWEGFGYPRLLRDLRNSSYGEDKAFGFRLGLPELEENREAIEIAYHMFIANLKEGDPRLMNEAFPTLYMTPVESYVFEALERLTARDTSGRQRITLPDDENELEDKLLACFPGSFEAGEISTAFDKFIDTQFVFKLGETSGERSIYSLVRLPLEFVRLSVSDRLRVPIQRPYQEVIRDLQNNRCDLNRWNKEDPRFSFEVWLKKAHPELNPRTTIQKLLGFALRKDQNFCTGWAIIVAVPDDAGQAILVAQSGFEPIEIIDDPRPLRRSKKRQ